MTPIEVPGPQGSADGFRLRAFRLDDAPALAASRSDPTTAVYQIWEAPYPLERAEALATEMATFDGPVAGQWVNTVIADAVTDTYLGDVAVCISDDERSAEVGYTLSPGARGRGLATLATARMIEWLFEHPRRHRVHAMIHPDNVASAMVLERLGFLFEGTDRGSCWVGDEVSDDGRYGMLRADWEAWRARPRTPPSNVSLIEVTEHNLMTVFGLRTHHSQERFVAPMPASLAQALVPESVDGAQVVPWFRAVEADGEIVGFAMVADVTAHHPEPFLWRLLIDRMHQRRAIGEQVVRLLADDRRGRGDRRLLTSWVPGHGSPEPFYLRLGFVPTGELVDGEIEAALAL